MASTDLIVRLLLLLLVLGGGITALVGILYAKGESVQRFRTRCPLYLKENGKSKNIWCQIVQFTAVSQIVHSALMMAYVVVDLARKKRCVLPGGSF